MKHLQTAVVAAAILLATTACGSSPEPAAATDQGDQLAPQQSTVGDREFPGANGEIAAIDGRTLQVQNPMEGQVAVTYTAKTAITAEVAAEAADLEVGDCVMVTGEGEDDVTATSVRISERTEGSCSPAGSGRFEGGPPPGDLQGELPEGVPTDLPDRAVMMGAFGEVTAVSANGFTVSTQLPGEESATTRQVTTSADTTWTDTVDADAGSLKVGKCVSARGDRDDTGALTATSISVADPVDGECMIGGLVRVGSAP